MTTSQIRSSRQMILATCVLAAAAAGGGAFERAAKATDTAVAIIAPKGSRLADDIGRELALSGFTVLMVARVTAARDMMDRARLLLSAELPLAVVVRADERQVLVVSRSPTSGIQAGFDLRLDSDDGLTRRRACLTVVEYLRVLGQGPGPVGEHALSGPRDAEAREARGTPSVHATASALVALPLGAPSIDEQSPRVPSRTMGIATAFDLSSTQSQPSGHLHFMWYFPLGTRLSFQARALWPILGVGFQSGSADVRMWTFGAALGLQYAFREPPARWRPLMGLVLGNSMQLTESSSALPTESRSAVTPIITVGLLGGLRYALNRRAQLLWELEVARGWLVASANRAAYETASANAFSIHASFGILFEY